MHGKLNRIFVLQLFWGVVLLQIASLCSRAEGQHKLVIGPVEGEGALNNIRQRTAREPIVRVEDENHRPVAGITVIFTLPDSGPSGTFVGGTRLFSTSTNQNGQAAATGFKPNHVVGHYQIRVSVNDGKSTSTATINEENYIGNLTSTSTSTSAASAAVHVFPLKLALIGAAIAGGVAGGIVALKTGGSSPIVISPGGTTVGAPQAQKNHH